MRGEIEPAMLGARSLLAYGERHDDRARMLAAHDLLSETCYYTARFSDSSRHGDEAMRLYQPERDATLESNLSQVFSVAAGSFGGLAKWHLGRTTDALRATHMSIKAAEEAEHPFSIAASHCFAAILSRLLEDEVGVRQHVSSAIHASERADLPLWRGIARLLSASLESAPDALDEMAVALGEMAGTGTLGGTYFLGLFAEKRRENGDIAGARELLDAALALVEQIGERHDEANLHLRRARLMDDPEQALACCRLAQEIALRQGSRALALRAFCDEADIVSSTGLAGAPLEPRIRALCDELDLDYETPELRRARELLASSPEAR